MYVCGVCVFTQFSLLPQRTSGRAPAKSYKRWKEGLREAQQAFPEGTMFVALHFVFNPVSAQIICSTTKAAEEIRLGGGEPKIVWTVAECLPSVCKALSSKLSNKNKQL